MKSIQVFLLACLFSAACATFREHTRQAPKLTFFCEVDPVTIPSISTPAVLSALRAMNATVSIAIRDFSVARANYVRLLNHNNITTTAWLVLNYTDGYWANINNANKFVQFYQSFYQWTQQNSLKWGAVGLDMEFDFNEVAGLATGDLSSFIAAIYGRLSYPQVLDAARATYNSLVAQIKAHGYRSESYFFPIMFDERRANRPLLELMFGTVDLRTTDLEVPMLYSSSLPNGLGFLKSYGRTPEAVAIGSAGGDALTANNFTKLYPTWSAMERDLLYSYQELTRNIYIYSLPGVVSEGWLQKIVELNWRKPLSLKDRLKIEFQGVCVNRDRQELHSLLRAPVVPTGSNTNWLAANDFDAFSNILEFAFEFLGLSA